MLNISYDFYLTSYGGSDLNKEAFTALLPKAGRYLLSVITLRDFCEPSEQVKLAACAAAEALFKIQNASKAVNPWIKSENTDGYSVTYRDSDVLSFSRSEESAMYNAIYRELRGTGLLYRGV